jgi:hypothetical protein
MFASIYPTPITMVRKNVVVVEPEVKTESEEMPKTESEEMPKIEIAEVPKKKKAGTEDKPKKPKSAWLIHVAETRAANPEMSYKEALKSASATYKAKKATAKPKKPKKQPKKVAKIVAQPTASSEDDDEPSTTAV